jgi:hypothetical protein
MITPKNKILAEKMRKLADRMMFGKGGMWRLLFSAPITVPLIFGATVIDRLTISENQG